MKKGLKNVMQVAVLAILLCTNAAKAQTASWVKNANHSFSGDNTAFAVTTDNLGNVYAWNYDAHPGKNFSSILKYDAAGNLTDTIRVDSNYNFTSGLEKHHLLITDNNGFLYACGYNTVNSTSAVSKISTSGVKQWIYMSSEMSYINDITLDASGNIVICGAANTTNYPARIEKINTIGIKQWATNFKLNAAAGGNQDQFSAVKTDASGNVYVTGVGRKENSTQFANIITGKFNAAGNKQWVKEYTGTANDDDAGYDLLLDAGNNIYVTGNARFTGVGSDLVLIKYDNNGTQLWAKQYGGNSNGYDYAYRIAKDAAGNLFIAGTAQQNACSNNRMILIKYDAAGTKLWNYQPPGCQSFAFTDFVADASGNLFVAGTIADLNYPIYTNQVLYKVSNAGASLGVKEINVDTLNNELAAALAVDLNGNAILTGSSTVDGIGYALVTKFNSAVAVQWTQSYQSESTDLDFHVTVLADKNGNSYTIGNQRTVLDKIFIDKRSKDGTILWRTNKYSKAAGQGAMATAATLDDAGNVYICGSDYDNNGYTQLMVAMYSPSGTEVWSRGYHASNGVDLNQANAIAVDRLGNVYITGAGYKNPTQAQNCYTLKYNASGVQQWVGVYNGANFNDAGIAIDVDTAGNVFVAATTVDASNTSNWVTIKYNSAGVQQWANQTGVTAANDAPADIKADRLGGCYVTGQTIGNPSGGGFTTKKYNSNGTVAWTKILKSCLPANDFGKEIEMDSTGNIYVTGSYYKCTGTDPSNIYRLYCQKFNSNGDSLWSYTRAGYNYYYYQLENKYSYTAIDNLSSAIFLTNVVVIQGQTLNPYKVEILKLNQSNGSVVWIRSDSLLSSTLQGSATFPYPSLSFDNVGALYSCYDASAGYNYHDTRTLKICEAPLATASVTAGALTTFCSGGSVAITANANNAASYLWTAGATTKVNTAVASNNYKCTVTYTDGCPYTTNAISVTVNPLPAATITASGPLTFCAGDSVTLQANTGAGLTYQWKKGSNNINGATQSSYKAKTAASYKVVVTNSNTCSKTSAAKKVVINCRLGTTDNQFMLSPNPASDITTLNFYSEVEDQITLSVIDFTGRLVFSKSYSIYNGDNTLAIDVNSLPAGIYILKLTQLDSEKTLRFIKN
jgi:hypothetical protein